MTGIKKELWRPAPGEEWKFEDDGAYAVCAVEADEAFPAVADAKRAFLRISRTDDGHPCNPVFVEPEGDEEYERPYDQVTIYSTDPDYEFEGDVYPQFAKLCEAVSSSGVYVSISLED